MIPGECDACIRKSDQWCYVAGDIIFCQFCDALFHRKTASLEISSPEIDQSQKWQQGFTKRHSKIHALHVVPEIETDESKTMISDDQFYYQVPVFHPFSGEQIQSDTQNIESEASFDHLNSINRLILPSDFELSELAANRKESFQTEEPGIKFEDEKSEVVCDNQVNIHDKSYQIGKMLKLDYDGIIAGWDTDRSPWTTGDRPEFDPNDRCKVGCGKICSFGDMRKMTVMNDVGREAKVSRYREKRQTRLFSKKIRYEVRKLNAEKRPRMKGRFVKRTSFSTV